MILDIKNCNKCALVNTRNNTVLGEGSVNGDYFMIAQAPGEVEDKTGKMFKGLSGKVFWYILEQAEADTSRIYYTNLLKCRLPKNRRPKQAEIMACAPYLEQEIRQIKPKIICPLGYYSTKYLLETRGFAKFQRAEYPDLLGKVFLTERYIIMPLSHPTSLIHHPEYTLNTINRYHRAFHLKHCKWFDVCPMKSYTLQRVIGFYWTDSYCFGDWLQCKRYQLEAQGKSHSDQMLPDGTYLTIDKE